MVFKKVDRKVLDHPVEKRGFVPVPLDYKNLSGEKIDIFYRLIPAHGSKPDDGTKPLMVIFNGGPGVPSHFYRSLTFDYGNPSNPANGSLDRFKYFSRTHRVLLIDQRGTAGQSSPIDMENPKLDAAWVARLFSSDSHARDFLAVINAVVPEGQKFFIIAQSYGGMPGMQYLSLRARRPAGIIFSCSALPYEDCVEMMMLRRREQLKLNLELKAAVPDIEKRLAAIRAHFVKIGVPEVRLQGLYMFLGKDVKGVWERELVAKIDKMLAQNKEEIEKDADRLGDVNLLNYILSSCNFTPGYTDRTLGRLTSERIPFEPWMLDENVLLMTTGQDGTWKSAFVEEFDRNPPAPTPFEPLEGLREALSTNRALFTLADNDALVPAEAFLKAAAKFQVPGHTELKRLPGGHHSIFLEAGYEAFLEWSARAH